MKKTFLILMAILLVGGSYAKKKNENKEKTLPDTYLVKLKDGSTLEGTLSKDWVRWPSKTINEDFNIVDNSGKEYTITVNEIDTIFDITSGDVFIAAYVPSPKIGNLKNTNKWIVKLGPKTSNGEIISYFSRYQYNVGQYSRWGGDYVHCMRFDNDSIVYPFRYPDNNGGFNLSIMKKWLKNMRPDAVEYINSYFKKNKEQRKQLYEKPELFIEVYEEYLKQK